MFGVPGDFNLGFLVRVHLPADRYKLIVVNRTSSKMIPASTGPGTGEYHFRCVPLLPNNS